MFKFLRTVNFNTSLGTERCIWKDRRSGGAAPPPEREPPRQGECVAEPDPETAERHRWSVGRCRGEGVCETHEGEQDFRLQTPRTSRGSVALILLCNRIYHILTLCQS